MTPEQKKQIEECVSELARRVDQLEENQDAIMEVPHVVDQLIGRIQTLHEIVVQGFDKRKKTIEVNGDEPIPKSRTTSNAMYAAQFILLPVILALISALAIILGGK